MENLNNYVDKTDAEIVALVLGNQSYFSCLIERYQRKLLAYIRRISNVSQEDAEDILQEVFIKVYQNLNYFDQSLKFSSWIYRITHNEVISAYRKHKSRPQQITWDINGDILNNLSSDLDLNHEVEKIYLSHHTNEILEKLDKKYREVLVLRFFEEKDYTEISDILKKPIGTVATLINRAKKQFKKELEHQNLQLSS